MNFSAWTTPSPTRLRRRRRVLGASVGVLVAVGLAAAASVGPSAMPVEDRVGARDVVAIAPPAAHGLPHRDVSAVVRVRPGRDRVHSELTGGAVPTAAAAVPAAVAPSTLPRSEPTRVRIPAIEVDSQLVGLGLQEDGRMEVPPGAFPAGWYTGAPTPGELGPAILAGHVDYGGRAGVFSRLRELAAGDPVEVVRADGSVAVFRVTRVEQHAKDAFPTAAVYGDIDHAGLRLITCGGSFDHGAHSYEDNIVVFAELVHGS